jgi:general secretion pathway protein F
MPHYRVRVHDGPAAASSWHEVEATSVAALPQALGVPAAKLLDVQALPAAPSRGWRLGLGLGQGQRGPAIDARAFAQELAVLLDSGVPLLDALQTLEERQGAAAAALQRVREGLREGRSLSQALSHAGQAAQPPQPAVVDEVLLALVAAAERDGQLAAVLRHHADFLAWSGALRAKLVAAALYPALLMATGLVVVGFLVVYVLPRFAGVFDGMAVALPWGSRVLIALGQAASAQPLVAGGLALLLPLALLLAWRTPAMRAALQAAAWGLPGLGGRLRTVALTRLYRAVGLLAAAGVPLPRALALAEPVLDAPLRPALARARAVVQNGQRLSDAWAAEGLATAPALRMLRVGEKSGELATMLGRAAAFHDEEVARLAEWLGKVVNPLLMLLMGLVVGGVVVLMYLPLFTLMEQVG